MPLQKQSNKYVFLLMLMGILMFIFPDSLEAAGLEGDYQDNSNVNPSDQAQITDPNSFHVTYDHNDMYMTIENWPETDQPPDHASQDRVSLQFWNGSASFEAYLSQLVLIPDPLSDYVGILSPNFFSHDIKDDGTFALRFADIDSAIEIVRLGKSRGAQVVPLIGGSGSVVENMLTNPDKRTAFVNCADTMVQDLDCDGLLIDFEMLSDHVTNDLNQLMEELYARLHPQGKLVIISVMPKTSNTAEPWLAEYDYATLAHNVDYIQIMSYDKHYTTSAPGPIAPLEWVESVMGYSVSKINDPNKILMGIPYYGRAWKSVARGYSSLAFGLSDARQTAFSPDAISRHTTLDDPVGIPTFSYIDQNGSKRIAYYDDHASWSAKLDLLEKYNLGGIGAWALNWLDQESAAELFPLLQQKLRTR